MATKVNILDHVRRVLDNSPGLADQLERDLESAFAKCQQVTVYALVNGFAIDHSRKIILAVEAQSDHRADGPRYRSLIVKVGRADEVGVDFEGWADVVRDRRTSPKIFLPLQRVMLPSDGDAARCAVLYENVSQNYRIGTTTENVLNFHDATIQAIENRFYTVDSLIRVIWEIFQELGQSFYSFANPDPIAMDFYRQKLRLSGNESPSIESWNKDLVGLRRITTWLSCANTHPTHPEDAPYLDPYDYVLWMLQHDRTPVTLVGPSHGDLHGMNILLDSTGDRESAVREAQSPTLIDYGDMATKNVPMWDFVKLETELKVRLLRKLYQRPEVRREAFGEIGLRDNFSRLITRWQQLEETDGRLPDLDDQTRWALFVLCFEQRLNRRFNELFGSDDLTDDRPLLGEAFNSSSSLVAAEVVLHAIRRESARWLCKAKGRTSCDQWRDEFDFGLAVYGLSTAKFSDSSYLRWNRIAALVSAGVAVKRYETRNNVVGSQCKEPYRSGPHPSYTVPLYHGYRAWNRSKDWAKATTWFQDAVAQFPTSVPLVREYALMLASQASELDRHEDDRGQQMREQAQMLLDTQVNRVHSSSTLQSICKTFDDFELPSRAGRICKDLADWDWKTYYPNRHPKDFGSRLARQYYAAARDFYRAAYQMSQDHYPGGNYAVTALLCGDEQEAMNAAADVAEICNDAPLRQMDSGSQYWVFATEATMALILGRSTDAAAYISRIVALTNQDRRQWLQLTYDQFCRLYCALDSTVFNELLAVLEKSPIALTAGPLTDCGGFTSKCTAV